MTTAKAATLKLAQELKARNEKGESWRAIAVSYPVRPDGSQIIKAGTLNRIAMEAGEWLPKDREILIALGLIKAKAPEPEHTRRIKRKIAKMAARTRAAVLKK